MWQKTLLDQINRQVTGYDSRLTKQACSRNSYNSLELKEQDQVLSRMKDLNQTRALLGNIEFQQGNGIKSRTEIQAAAHCLGLYMEIWQKCYYLVDLSLP